MQQPAHDLRPFQALHSTPRRAVGIGLVVLFHILVIYAIASGLASQLAQKLPDELKAEVVREKIPDVKPPPPPPPEMVKPPPPFVPPPEIDIQAESPTAITVQTKVATPPPGITAPASIGAPHECNERFYPPIAVRLNQEGTTTIAFKIMPDGSVSGVTVTGSSGFDSLDQAALNCAASWRYRPAMENGQAIEAAHSAVVKWTLR